jgi:transcriptional regulator with XRE-family HTH domain
MVSTSLAALAMISAMPPRKLAAPTLRLRRLAAELRRLRAAAGLTREEVTERTDINGVTLYRLERAQARPQRRTLNALMDLYGVDDQSHRAELLDLARQAGEETWLQSFPSELPEVFTTYILFESEARTVLNYETAFVPGLLQTEGYARAMYLGAAPTATKEEIQPLVEARMGRQAVLTRDPPLRLWAIVDEGALHRLVGGPEVMAAQLEHVAEAVTEMAHVTFQVIPYDAGAHPGMMANFALLQFGGDPPSDVIFHESGGGDLFLESEAHIARFTAIFEHLRAMALSPEHSTRLVRRLARELRGGAEA